MQQVDYLSGVLHHSTIPLDLDDHTDAFYWRTLIVIVSVN